MLRLDINLVITIMNLLVLYFLLKKFLFKPVNAIIAQREAAIKQQFEEAEKTKKQADELKKEYEAALENARTDSAKMVTEAKERAREEYDRILKSADEDVARKMQKAEETLAEEKAKSMRRMENEIENLVLAAATKVVGEKVTVENSRHLYDEFLMEMGETK